MPEVNTPILVHIGSIREESLRILQTAALPTFIATLENESGKVEALKSNVPRLFVAEHPITSQGDDAVLHKYSLSEFNSLAPVSGLKKLYPGLVEKQHRTVETHTLEAALKAHKLNAAPIAQLIIEQLESAQALLQTLEAQGQLHSLTKLWVRTSPESLYAGMPTQSELIATCEQLGFEIVDTQADDPDFVLVEFKRNPLYSEYKKLQEKAAKLAQREKEQAATNEKAQAETIQLKQEREKLTKQQESLREQLRTQQQRNQALEAEMQATQARQNKLAIELERAEAQLDLIKDLLLKDKLLQR
ncbi:hypothetical protein [Vreelandella titanicae]|uniref:hypothetical protein n=1 Tax=Vreelandella titanicae TaxID=664683 RepID=UPI003D2695B8